MAFLKRGDTNEPKWGPWRGQVGRMSTGSCMRPSPGEETELCLGGNSRRLGGCHHTPGAVLGPGGREQAERGVAEPVRE